jgi:pyruvate,water dikinase
MIDTLKGKGIHIPDGFATTSKRYWEFVDINSLKEKIESYLKQLANGEKSLKGIGKSIQELFLNSSKNIFPVSSKDLYWKA